MKSIRIWYWCCITLLALPALSHSDTLADLEYITENYPPFNYVEGGVLRGEAVDLLLSATALSGNPIRARDISVQPWARAFHNALEGPNRVLFSTTRTPERERLFKWAGPIGSNHVVLVAKRSSNIRLDTLAELERYKVGAIRDDVGELFLRELHLEKSIITLGVQPDSIAKMLQSGRVDLWAYGESSAKDTLKKIGAKISDYEVVRVLKTLDLYYAFSQDVPDKLVAELQAAIDTIRGGEAMNRAPAEARESQLYIPANGNTPIPAHEAD